MVYPYITIVLLHVLSEYQYCVWRQWALLIQHPLAHCLHHFHTLHVACETMGVQVLLNLTEFKQIIVYNNLFSSSVETVWAVLHPLAHTAVWPWTILTSRTQ